MSGASKFNKIWLNYKFEVNPEIDLKLNKNKNLTDSKAERVLYIWHYLEWGGAQVYFFGLMKEAKKIADVLAIMPAGSNKQLLNFLDNLQVPYQFFPASTGVQPARGFADKIAKHWEKIYCEYVLWKFLKKFNLENNIVHAEFAPWQSMIILLLLCRRTPVFLTVHNALPVIAKWRFLLWKMKFWLLTSSKNFHLFTANNNAKNSLKRFVSAEFFDSIRVTYANINPAEIEEALKANINREEFSGKYNLPENKFLVFCVGQFIDRKGRWIFLEAARALLKDNEDIAFVWISNYRPSAEDFLKVETFGLGENFVFLSSEQIGSEHIDLFKLMRLADVFALPSYIEGLPISIIEAMALGIPTISTDINAIPEAVKSFETGILIEPGDSEALRKAVQTLKDDKKLRENLAIKGREYALEKFDERVVAKIAVERYIESLPA